jgi:hypothetical protein
VVTTSGGKESSYLARRGGFAPLSVVPSFKPPDVGGSSARTGRHARVRRLDSQSGSPCRSLGLSSWDQNFCSYALGAWIPPEFGLATRVSAWSVLLLFRGGCFIVKIMSAPSTSRPWGPSGVLRSAADDGSTTGIGSLRVSARRLVPGLLLGDRSLAPFTVPCLRTGAPFAATSRSSCFLLSPNFSVILAFLLMYLRRENSLLGPSSKVFRRVLFL